MTSNHWFMYNIYTFNSTHLICWVCSASGDCFIMVMLDAYPDLWKKDFYVSCKQEILKFILTIFWSSKLNYKSRIVNCSMGPLPSIYLEHNEMANRHIIKANNVFCIIIDQGCVFMNWSKDLNAYFYVNPSWRQIEDLTVLIFEKETQRRAKCHHFGVEVKHYLKQHSLLSTSLSLNMWFCCCL